MVGPSWFERVFGISWSTTLAGSTGGVLAIVCILVGAILGLDELKTIGLTILGGTVIALGKLGRSEDASTKAHKEEQREIAAARLEEARHHQESLRRIESAKEETKQEVRQELQRP